MKWSGWAPCQCHSPGAHLHHLARQDWFEHATAASQIATPTLLHLLGEIDGIPACIVGPAMDVIAANDLVRALYTPFARFENLALNVFLDPAAQGFYTDWEGAARGTVSNLRAVSAPFRDDPMVREVVDELNRRSPTFAALWAQHDVGLRRSQEKRIHHPDVGELCLHYEGLGILETVGQQLFVWLADPGSRSAEALRHLMSRAE